MYFMTMILGHVFDIFVDKKLDKKRQEIQHGAAKKEN